MAQGVWRGVRARARAPPPALCSVAQRTESAPLAPDSLFAVPFTVSIMRMCRAVFWASLASLVCQMGMSDEHGSRGVTFYV